MSRQKASSHKSCSTTWLLVTSPLNSSGFCLFQFSYTINLLLLFSLWLASGHSMLIWCSGSNFVLTPAHSLKYTYNQTLEYFLISNTKFQLSFAHKHICIMVLVEIVIRNGHWYYFENNLSNFVPILTMFSVLNISKIFRTLNGDSRACNIVHTKLPP